MSRYGTFNIISTSWELLIAKRKCDGHITPKLMIHHLADVPVILKIWSVFMRLIWRRVLSSKCFHFQVISSYMRRLQNIIIIYTESLENVMNVYIKSNQNTKAKHYLVICLAIYWFEIFNIQFHGLQAETDLIGK